MRFSIGLVAAALLALAPKPPQLTLPVKDTALSVELLPVVDAGQVRVWIGRTEVRWELLDAFVYEKADAEQPAGADAVARPSKPYISMDRGFGHAGFPAISVNIDTAQQFCAWLSKRTGRSMRLPTVAELRSICPDDKAGQPTLDQRAWHAGNSGGTTHKVGSSKTDAQGFSDLQGNVAEWAIDATGKPPIDVKIPSTNPSSTNVGNALNKIILRIPDTDLTPLLTMVCSSPALMDCKEDISIE